LSEPLRQEHGPYSPEEAAAASRRRRQPIVLVGNPNVGKSALFGALTGRYVTVSNYPGTTVEIARGAAVLDGVKRPVLDTPGASSLLPCSEDERVTRDLLLSERPHAVVAVGDAKNLERSLVMALQLAEAGLPYVLCVNMTDEAEARGIAFDTGRLACALEVDVIATVAVHGRGIDSLRGALASPRAGRALVSYPDAVERAIASIEPFLPEAPVSPRALAVLALAGDDTLTAWLQARAQPDALRRIDEAREQLRRRFLEPIEAVVTRARLAEAGRVAAAALGSRSGVPPGRNFRERLEALTTHPLWGIPLLLGVLWACYWIVGVFGAGTLVDLLEDRLFGRVISPAATALADRLLPWAWLRDLFVGEYGVVTMALAYSLALVLPIVATFFLVFGMLEDSGYLPRLAVLVNPLFRRFGLNGKAVLPMVLGLGCDTMATLTTRVLETRKERLLVILLLALGVPCSAQLTVVLALLGGISAAALLLWAAVLLAVMALVGRLANRLLPGRGSDFVLEIPPLRVPRPGNLLAKTVARVEWYLKEAVPLFVLGTLVLFVADRLGLLVAVERIGEPVVSGILGLPRETAEAFVVGFLRRDFGAAGLYRLWEQGSLSPEQALVATTTITLFIPCLANFLMIVHERGWKTALAIAAFVFPFAVAVGALLHLFLRAVPLL
jgi:ferrous iron transport protein B